MKIFSHQSISDFIAMRSYVFRDESLTLEEKGLYGVLYTMAQRGQEDVSRYVNINDLDNISDLLKSLNRKGYIEYDGKSDSIAIPESSFKESEKLLS